MKNIYIIITLVLSLSSWSQIVNIPDVNFKAKLLEADISNEIAKDANDNKIRIDVNNNGEIEVNEALLVSKLFYIPNTDGPPPFRLQNSVQSLPFTDLTGIAAFSNLTYLKVVNHQLTTLDMSNNLLLERLLCDGNQLTSLNVSGLANLIVLWTANNDLTSLDISDLVELVNFDCRGNAITTLDFLQSTQLRYLECSGNQLSSLDLTNSTQLRRLMCYTNQITALNLNAQTTLEYLYCFNNQITSAIDLNNYTALMFFMCYNNQISSLSFGNNPFLQQVWCGQNTFSVLDLSGTAVNRLSCGDNPNLTFLNVKNGIVTPDLYVSQFPEPPYTEDSFKLLNTPSLNYICHDEGEFGPTLVMNEGLENVSRGTYCSFTPGGNYNTISGTITFDCGGTSTIVANHSVNVTGGSQSGVTFTNNSGLYQFYSGATTVSVTPQITNPNYFTISPANYSFNFSNFGNMETADFCISANGVHPDLAVSILPIAPARPGFDATYKIVFTNNGNQIQSGSVTFSFDDTVLDLISAIPNVSSQMVNSLSWDFTNLYPLESREIQLTLNVNSPVESPAVNIGDILSYSAMVSSAQTDETPQDNQIAYNQTVIGAFDPNDKEVIEGLEISIARIGDYLHYIIRFQNTGTASAENVVIRDVLSDNLDWSSLHILSSSHPYRSTLTAGNKLEVFYENINLPAVSVDEPGSHGYVAFKIKPKSTLVVNDEIENQAGIYFDYNFPVLTNTVSTAIAPLLGIPANDIRLFKVYPNPTSGIVNIAMANNQPIAKVSITNLLGQSIMVFENTSTLNISSLSKGTYFITVETNSGSETQKIIKF